MGFVARVFQPSTLRMLICPEASNAQNNMAAVSADGSTVCVLILRLNSSCSRSIALVVRALRHWLGGKRVKGKSRSPASSRLLGFVLEPPLADEGFAMLFDLFRRFRVDHFIVVLGDLLMQALRGVGQQITMLMHGAPLHRYAIPNGGDRALEPRAAIDDEQLGPLQAAPDEIVEDRAPGLGALAAHLFDRQEHFLTVLAHPDDDQQ